jgi:hypothetical protein
MANQDSSSLDSHGSMVDRPTPSSSSPFDSHFPISCTQPSYLDFAHSAAQSELDSIWTAVNVPTVGSCQNTRGEDFFRRQHQAAPYWGLNYTDLEPCSEIVHPARSQSPTSCDGNEISSDNDMPLFDIPAQDTPTLDPDHEFAKYTNDLTTLGQTEFLRPTFVDKGSSEKTRDRRFPAQAKRLLKVVDFEAAKQNNPPSGDDELVIQRDSRYILACPFYKHSPSKYRECLTRVDLRSIQELLRHLWNSHRRPHYCPVCFKQFDSAEICDDHIRERSCPLRQASTPDGVSEDQIQQLSQPLPTLGDTEFSQWNSIWNIVFPQEQAPSVPYLSGELESTICELRCFWSERGEKLIASFLEKQKLQEYEVRDEERNLRALHRIVLEQMIDNFSYQTIPPALSGNETQTFSIHPAEQAGRREFGLRQVFPPPEEAQESKTKNLE